MPKRVYKDAFKRKFLKNVKVDDIFVKLITYKVTSQNELTEIYSITTTENEEFKYYGYDIKTRSKSATAFDEEQTVTKNKLMNLFANISTNDVWSAEYQTFDKTKEWYKELAQTIQGLPADKAGDYIKKNSRSFGKVNRKIIGRKINIDSINNYYMVHDLAKHFEIIEEGCGSDFAMDHSIRNLDVNSIQYLIFNGVKYISK